MSDSSRQMYLDHIDKLQGYDNTDYVVLAMASNGCWSTAYGLHQSETKRKAIKNCKKLCKSSCEIYDINGTSDFIKKKSSSTSSSTSGASSNSSTSVTGSSTVFMSDQDKTKYLSWLSKLQQGDAEGKCWGGECRAALAVGPNGCWAKFPDMSLSRTKKEALKKCSSDCSTNDCQIMDIDGKSAFIKQRGSSASPSAATSSSSSLTTSSSGQIWCLTKGALSRTSQSHCETNSGQVITSSRAESYIGRGSVYCYYPKNNVWYWATGSCPAGEKEISMEEYYSLWCVAEGWSNALQMDASKCDSNDGMVFATKPEAEIELKRLKQDSTSTTAKTAPDPTIELEYWQLVKDSNDPDLLQSYLDEYPNGKFAPLARLKIKKLNSSSGNN